MQFVEISTALSLHLLICRVGHDTRWIPKFLQLSLNENWLLGGLQQVEGQLYPCFIAAFPSLGPQRPAMGSLLLFWGTEGFY